MMDSFDWLSDMDVPSEEQFDIIEVRFKAGKKGFFRNVNRLSFYTGDPVVVSVQNGHHVGYVSMQGELVRLQMRKKQVQDNEDIFPVLRLATERDMTKFGEVKKREIPTLYRTREIIGDLGLSMKLTDIEFQADNTKATFFYSADDRVDFRELIKVLASEFRIRVEMRQISLRQEASRLGGIGSCGRELCCSTWLSDFKSVSTSAARYQNLSLNPSKLSGQCGRLKCCLNYELETYIEALQDIPELDKPIKTQKGEAKLQKTDIFRRIMWFGYENENTWHPISVERVVEILEQNSNGIIPETLQEDKDWEKEAKALAISEQLEEMDKKFRDKAKKSRSSRARGGRRKAQASSSGQAGGSSEAKKKTGKNQNARSRSRRKAVQHPQGGEQAAKLKNGTKANPKKENSGASSPKSMSKKGEGANSKTEGKPRRNYGNRRKPKNSGNGHEKKQ